MEVIQVSLCVGNAAASFPPFMALLEQPRVNSKVIEPTVSKVGDLFTM
jgi:hypothetical protein